MFEDIKITMLGTTGAGKTCYMLGMHAVMQLGVHGFTLTAQDLDEDIKLSNQWDALVEKGQWPDATPEPHTYSFNFNYGAKPIMGFQWLDYRGGAMSDISTVQDVEVLRNYLKGSSCVFLCVSGEYLRNSEETGLMAVAKSTKVDKMNQYLVKLGETIQPNDSKPFPIVIAITKYDLCSHRKKDEIYADIRKIFNPLFTADSGWLVMVCPVSLGKELANNGDRGQINPRNVHLPLVFAFYSKFREFALAEKEVTSGLNDKLSNLQNGNKLKKWWQSNEIKKVIEAIGISQSRLNQIQTKLQLLAQELGQVELYLSGEEIEVDI